MASLLDPGRSRSPELSWVEFDLWFEVAFKIAGNPENCGKSFGVSWSMVTFCVVVLRVKLSVWLRRGRFSKACRIIEGVETLLATRDEFKEDVAVLLRVRSYRFDRSWIVRYKTFKVFNRSMIESCWSVPVRIILTVSLLASSSKLFNSVKKSFMICTSSESLMAWLIAFAKISTSVSMTLKTAS